MHEEDFRTDPSLEHHALSRFDTSGWCRRTHGHCLSQAVHANGRLLGVTTCRERLLRCPQIDTVFVVVSADDAYVDDRLQTQERLRVLRCGGATRAETVSKWPSVCA